MKNYIVFMEFFYVEKSLLTFLILMKFFILYMIILTKFNPLMLSIFLMMLTILIALDFTLLASTSFYSFILFMSMIGGLTIIFMYFSSLSNFKKPNINMNLWMMLIFLILLTSILIYLENNQFNNIFNFDLLNLNTPMFNFMNLNEMMYFYPEYKMLILMISFLFLSLLCIVKICNMKSSPIRKFN